MTLVLKGNRKLPHQGVDGGFKKDQGDSLRQTYSRCICEVRTARSLCSQALKEIGGGMK